MWHVNVTQKTVGCVLVCFSRPVWIYCLNSFVHPSCTYIHSSSYYLSTHPSQDFLLINSHAVFSLCKCSAIISFIVFHNSIIVYRYTGCGTCQDSKYNIVKHKYYTLHIDIDTYYVNGSGKHLYP